MSYQQQDYKIETIPENLKNGIADNALSNRAVFELNVFWWELVELIHAAQPTKIGCITQNLAKPAEWQKSVQKKYLKLGP